MPRVLLVVFVIAVAFWVVSIVDCAVQPADRHRGVNKPAWLAIVVLIPVLGGILWFTIGRVRRHKAGVGHRAPDDDPDFLSGLGSHADQDERIRQLEEELARLDAEGDDPRTPRGSVDDGVAEADDTDGDDPRSPRSGTIS